MENQNPPPPPRPVTGYPAPPNPNGHPYPQSQPYPAYPAYYGAAPPPYQPNPSSTFFRKILIFTITFFFIFGAVLLIVWLVVRPRLPDFEITSLSVTNLTATDSHVTGTWDARFHSSNPNKKMTVSYYDVVSSIFFKSNYLTRTQIAPFRQDTGAQTNLTAIFSVIDSYVDSKVVGDINSERSHGTIYFNVKLEAIAGYRYGWWRIRRRVLGVWCDSVPTNVSSSGSGSMVGGSRKCRVGM